MAGMLPGVETARRRRLPGSGGLCDSPSSIGSAFGSTRIRVFHDTHLTSPYYLQTSMVNQSDEDDKLSGAAREAKERLDGRLRGHLKKETTRRNNQERLNGVGWNMSTTPMVEVLEMQVSGLKKSGLKRYGWRSRKSSDEPESTIRLDRLRASEEVTPFALCPSIPF